LEFLPLGDTEMPINPQIPLMAQGVDLGQALLSGLQGAQSIQSMQQAAAEQPYRQALLQAQAEAAPIAVEAQRLQNLTSQQKLTVQGAALAAQQAVPYLQSGDMAGLRNFISRTNLLDEQDKSELLGKVDANDLQGILSDVSGAIGMAQQMGIFETPRAEADGRTSIQKNLEAAGFQPGTPEYRQALFQQMNKPSGTNVTVQMPGQKFLTAEAEALGKAFVKKFEGIQTEAAAATQQRDTLRQIKALNIDTGLTADLRANVANVMNNLGLNGNEILNTDVSNVQAFNKLSGRLVQEGLMAQKGVATDSDARLYAKTVPSITDNKKATNFIIESMNAQNERKIEKDQFFTDWLDANQSFKGADKAWNQYISSTPLYIEGYNNRIGLPYTFYEFSNEMKTLNSGVSEPEIIKLWQNKAKGI
jgi:hypothetical protein